MTHRAHMPQPVSDTAHVMGEHLFRESVAERVDLGDMRTVLRCLHDGGWNDVDKAAHAEAALEYARARVQRRNMVRDHLAGQSLAIAFAVAFILLPLRPHAAWALEVDATPIAARFLGLLIGLLPLVFLVGFALYLTLRGRPLLRDQDEVYGDTTLFGEREP